MAATRALGIPELLEMVLFRLPMRDLLLAQRVSKTWRSAIKGSKKLQRALFYEPIAGGPLTFREIPNSILGYFEGDWVPTGSHGPPQEAFYQNVLAHDFIRAMSPWDRPERSMTLIEALPASWSAPEASWKRMLFSQPASTVDVAVYDMRTSQPRCYTPVARLTVQGELVSRLGSVAAEIEKFHGRGTGNVEMECWVGGRVKWRELEGNEELERLHHERGGR